MRYIQLNCIQERKREAQRRREEEQTGREKTRIVYTFNFARHQTFVFIPNRYANFFLRILAIFRYYRLYACFVVIAYTVATLYVNKVYAILLSSTLPLRHLAVSTLRIHSTVDVQRGWEAPGGLFALITPAVDDNRSLAGG